MPLDDENEGEFDGFEPDEFDDDLTPFEQLDQWATQNGLWFPDDYIQPYAGYPDPANIRGEPFPTVASALERYGATGAFPFITILFDPDTGLFFVAVEYEDA